MEDKERQFRQKGHSRWLYFFLGVFVAAAIGLAIALGVTLVKDDDDQSSQPGTARPFAATDRPNAVTERPRPQTEAPHPATQTPVAENIQGLCITPSCVYRAGELLQAMDRSVDPCEDFYQYSCGNWIRTHSIPESQSSYSRFGQLRDTVSLELRGLLEKPYDSAKESASIRKAKNLYWSCVNEERLDKLGGDPLKTLVQQLGTWPLTSPGAFSSTMDLESMLVKLGLVELSPLIDVTIYMDEKNSSRFITWIDQLSLGLDRDYMLKGRNSPEVKAYEELKRQQAIHVLDVTPSSALTTAISDVVEFEIKLAQMTASQTDRRNSEKYYKKMTMSQLSAEIPKFNWMKFLSGLFHPANMTITQDTEIAMFAEDYIKSMLTLYETTDKRIVANYLLMYVVDSYSGYLSKDIRDLYAPLRKVLYGVTQTRARWKTCVDRVGGSFMPTAVGQLYVSTYFTPAAKDKALEMVGHIRESMKQMIRDVDWMDEATKNKALEKADAIVQKIGYPAYQFNETVMEKFYGDADYQPDTYFKNGLDSARLAVIQNIQNLNLTPSRADWSDSASTVNAFYSSSRNAITFPAGILQPPFYGEDFPMSMTFGGIGMVIGHEITHGFDDQGRKSDKEGNSIPWWSDSSVRNYQDLASCFVDQYSQQLVVDGLHVNGNLTLGENIADNGGIKASFSAFQEWQSLNGKQPVLPGLGLSHEQIFFVNFAQGWCNLITDEGARDRLLTDPHSPDGVRVRVSVSNSEDFADAFKCPVGSRMNPAKKCALW